MLKKLFILAFAGVLLHAPAQAAGTIPFSLSQQLDQYGKPLAGCKLYIIQAGTTSTPQLAYQNSGLTNPSPGGSILTCDAAGRLPQFFLADGLIKIRLADKNGTTQVVADGIQVIGPSGGGGGGGGTVDATTILQTGDIKARYGTGVLSGFVRANGRTIGSATSGATERASAETQPLFEYLWSADTNLVVSGGRGASANADWVANKTIALPDARSRAIAGLDDMGASPAGLLANVAFTFGNPTILGARAGAAQRTLLMANLPASPAPISSFSVTLGDGSLNGAVGLSNVSAPLIGVSTGGGGGATHNWLIADGSGGIVPVAAISSGLVMGNLGSGTAFDALSPYVLVTLYVKL